MEALRDFGIVGDVAVYASDGTGRRGDVVVRHLVDAASRFGPPLLAADDAAAYDDVLVETLERPDFQVWYEAFVQFATSRVVAVNLGAPVSDGARNRLVRVFGDSATLAYATLTYIDKVHRCWVGQLSSNPASRGGELSPPAVMSAFRVLEHPDLPGKVGLLIVDALYAEIEALGFLHAMAKGRRLPAETARRLVSSMHTHRVSGARLLTLVPGLKVPVSLVPRSKRLNFAELQSEHYRARLQASMRTLDDIGPMLDP